MVKINEAYLRSGLFGLQDGIVSTTGVVAGISAGIEDKTVIVMAALVAVMVEASSMAAGQYTSEKAAHELESKPHSDNLLVGAVIMFVAYFLAGMVPVIPTIVLSQPLARYVSIGGAFIALFVVGYVKGKLVNHSAMRSATELLVIGGIATIIGLVVGSIFKV